MSGTRQRAAALVALTVGSGLLLLAAGRPWHTHVGQYSPGAGLPAPSGVRTGLDLVPGLSALGFVGLAGVLAVLATRGWLRVLSGALIAAAGGLAGGLSLTAPDGSGGGIVSGARTGWPFLAAGSALVIGAAGVVIMLRGRGWSAMSARYETPAARAAARTATAEEGARSSWDALDRGEDPTES